MSPISLLQGISLSFTYPARPLPLLQDVSFRIALSCADRSRIGLIGPNGHGKSTLLSLVAGDREVQGGRWVRPSTHLRITWLKQVIDPGERQLPIHEYIGSGEVNLPALAKQLQQIERELETKNEHDESSRLLQRYSKLQQQFEAAGGYDFESRLHRALADLGLANVPLDRKLESLSEGQAARVRLLRTFLHEADLYLLDEPTNHLDLPAIEWLETRLQKTTAAYIVISHDRAFLDHVTSETWHLNRGVLETFPGPYSDYQQHADAALQEKIHRAESSRREIRRLQESMWQRAGWSQRLEGEKTGDGHADRGFIGHQAAKQAARSKAVEKRIRKEIAERQKNLPFIEDKRTVRFSAEGKMPSPLAWLRHLDCTMGDRSIFHLDQFAVQPRDRIALTGPNGSGKTTLLRLLHSESLPVTGELSISSATRSYLLPQNPHGASVFQSGAGLTVLQWLRRACPGEEEGAIRTMMGCYGISGEDIHRCLAEISPGMVTRMLLVEALLTRANLLLLDEPTNHLDIDAIRMLEEGLQEYEGGLVIASHDRRFIKNLGATPVSL